METKALEWSTEAGGGVGTGVLPGFLMPVHLYLLVSGERADTFEGLHPLREACEGGWDFQEAFLQRGGEERLGLSHAALPGPLPQCSPGNTHPRLCPVLWGCSAKGKSALVLLAQ